MDNAGILTIYALTDTAGQGYMPAEKLVALCQCFYSDRVIGYNRAYAAMGADQRVDRLVRCYYTTLPEEGKYAILEDGKQYRITLKQQIGDDCDLTLERLETNYDVLTDDVTDDDTDDSGDPSEPTDNTAETV